MLSSRKYGAGAKLDRNSQKKKMRLTFVCLSCLFASRTEGGGAGMDTEGAGSTGDRCNT